VAPKEIIFYPANGGDQDSEPDQEHWVDVERSFVIDFAGLSETQEEDCSFLIGGDARQVKKITDYSDVSAEKLASAGTFVFKWGDPQINQVLELVRGNRPILNIEQKIVVATDHMAYKFSAIAKRLNETDQVSNDGDTRHFEPFDDDGPADHFDPREYYGHNSVVVIGWENKMAGFILDFFDHQNLYKVPFYVELDKYYLQFAMGTDIDV
jgi:hypothetical protein